MTNAILFLCIGTALGIQLNRFWPDEKQEPRVKTVFFDRSSFASVFYNRLDDPWHMYSAESGYVTVPVAGTYEIKNSDGFTFDKTCEAGDKFLNPIYVKRLGPKP